jgi:hypothetical protein
VWALFTSVSENEGSPATAPRDKFHERRHGQANSHNFR